MRKLNLNSSDKSIDTKECDTFSLTNIIIDKTFFKVQQGPAIDITHTKRPRSFQKQILSKHALVTIKTHASVFPFIL